MYPLDVVLGLVHLPEHRIKELEKEGVIKPKLQNGQKLYSYTDIYVLNIVVIALRNGIRFKNIKYAYDCLKGLKPDRRLSSFTLYHNGKEILDFTDDIGIIASKYGQTINKNFCYEAMGISQLSVGSELDLTRQKFVDFTKALKDRRRQVKKEGSKKSMDEIRHLIYGKVV